MKTSAWILKPGVRGERGKLEEAEIELPPVGEDQVLIKPLVGCWEGNMSHAIKRLPIDLPTDRNEPYVVLGNSGVGRVLEVGKNVRYVSEGDLCLALSIGEVDKYGYTTKVNGYDAKNTMGVLAKQSVLNERSLLRLPAKSKYSLAHWAAFSLRYVTAWANWQTAHTCWRSQMHEADMPSPYVWGWGGGTTFAEVHLARILGAHTFMCGSSEGRLEEMRSVGITAVDRRPYSLECDEKRFATDRDYRAAYSLSEKKFIDRVEELTDGNMVSIFVDYVGGDLFRTTLRCLARQGVITSAGWSEGMKLTSMRAIECISRHIHVHTHYARRQEAVAAIRFAERTGWLPPVDTKSMVPWEEIPALGDAHADNITSSYFPLFSINRE